MGFLDIDQHCVGSTCHVTGWSAQAPSHSSPTRPPSLPDPWFALKQATMTNPTITFEDLEPELILHIADTLVAGHTNRERLSHLFALMRVNRRFLDIVAPLLYREIHMKCDAEKLRVLRNTRETDRGHFLGHIHLLRLDGQISTTEERNRAVPIFFDIFRLNENIQTLQYYVDSPMDWPAIGASNLRFLDWDISGPSAVAAEAMANAALPPSLTAMEVSSYLAEDVGPDLSSVFDLIARTDTLQSWVFTPFSTDGTGLDRFPAAVRKLRELWTFSYNDHLLSLLSPMPEFQPETLKISEVTMPDWHRIRQLRSLKHLVVYDSSTDIFSWGLPPMLQSLKLSRPRATLLDTSYADVRNRLSGVPIEINGGVFTFPGGAASQGVFDREGREYLEVWRALPNVTFV